VRKSEPGVTLASAAAAGVRLIVWCWDCRHPAEHATRYGPQTTVVDWKARLVCTSCGSRKVDMVVSGTAERSDDSRALLRPDRGIVIEARVRKAFFS
jgi:hypothetical protein